MSMLIGQGATGGFGSSLLQQSDDRAMPKNFQWDFAGTRSQIDPWADGMLWPRSQGLGGQFGQAQLLGGEFGRFENDAHDVIGGMQQRKIIGTTKDAAGNPLGSCIVQGFVTATDQFVGQMTSDSAGYYEFPTPYVGAQHYLVAYKAGSPDVTGATLNTLTPS